MSMVWTRVAAVEMVIVDFAHVEGRAARIS